MKKLINKIGSSSLVTKTTALVTIASAMMLPTFCTGIPALDNAKNFIFKLAEWAGAILILCGAGMAGKAFLDSQSGNGQPGAMPKALGVLALGAILFGGATAITAITGA